MRRALVVLACVVGAAIAAVGALAAFGVIHAYRLTGSSMEPTLHCARPGSGCLGSRGDRVATVRKWLVSPSRDDLVAVRVPARAAAVCGLPAGSVLIKRIVRVRGGRYFLEGDNRGASCDSRAWGAVRRARCWEGSWRPTGHLGVWRSTESARFRYHSARLRPPFDMSTIIQDIERRQLRDVPRFKAGDTVRVHFRVIEGARQRIQVFEGIVIKRQGAGARETFTVRKNSFGVGVERTFPLHSPKIDKIDVAAIGDVNRAKLYYLRGKVGKKARVRELRQN